MTWIYFVIFRFHLGCSANSIKQKPWHDLDLLYHFRFHLGFPGTQSSKVTWWEQDQHTCDWPPGRGEQDQHYGDWPLRRSRQRTSAAQGKTNKFGGWLQGDVQEYV